MRERGGFVAVVGDEQDGRRRLIEGGPQVGDQVGPGGGVQPGERLVEQQYPRPDGESSGDGHALGLAAGQRAGVTIGEVRDPERVEPRPGESAGSGPAHSPQPQAGGGVVEHGGPLQDGALQHGRDGGAQLRRRDRLAVEEHLSAVAGSRRASARSSVDFPAPFGPSTATVSPSATSRESTASR